jgi:ribosomal protein S24E
MRSKMGALREQYYKEVKKEKEAPPRVERIRHKLMLEAIRRIPELVAIENLSDDDLIKLYYEGAVPRRKELKKKLLPVLELPKK